MNSATMISSKDVTKAKSSARQDTGRNERQRDRAKGGKPAGTEARGRRFQPHIEDFEARRTAISTKGMASMVWAITKPVDVPTSCVVEIDGIDADRQHHAGYDHRRDQQGAQEQPPVRAPSGSTPKAASVPTHGRHAPRRWRRSSAS